MGLELTRDDVSELYVGGVNRLEARVRSGGGLTIIKLAQNNHHSVLLALTTVMVNALWK